MASWNFNVYFYHRFHNFPVNPTMTYDNLKQIIVNHFKIPFNNYFLEIHDLRFRRYVLLDQDYVTNLQNYLPRTHVNTLNGRIIKRERPKRDPSRNYASTDCKRKRTSSFLPQTNHLIIWLDSYIGHPENCRQLKHNFYITTMLDIARSMLDYEYCIDDLIQTNSISINNQKYFNTFTNKDECLDFLKRVESTMKILFITSNFYGEEIVPLIVKRVHMIYILVNDGVFSYEWAYDYISNLLIFHEVTCLLVRLMRDLAQDLFEKAELTLQSSVKQTITLLRWARKLYSRANEIDSPPPYLATLKSITRQLEKLEWNEKLEDINHEKEDKFALECDEG